LQNIKNIDEILFLIWPRQAWKTTLLKSLVYFWYFNEKEIIFLEWNTFFENQIDSFWKFIDYLKLNFDLTKYKILIIDEAQLVPNLWNILFQFINEIRRWKYNLKLIVSWSWSLQIFRNLTDSLVGRKYVIKVFPFDFQEFLKVKWKNYFFSDSRIAIDQYLKLVKEYWLFGGYPKVVLEESVSQKFYYLKEIYQSVVEKDIRYLLKENEILNLNKVLLEIGKTLWSQITFSQIVENAGVKRYEFEKIKFILENTFLIKSIWPYISWKLKKEVKKKEKIYFLDMWILRLILWYTFENVEVFIWKIVENFVFSQIFYNLEEHQDLYFWASYNEVEIDFIVKDLITGKLVCIDAKQKEKDNIPKWYLIFCKNLKDYIKKFIITTKYLIKDRNEDCKFRFLPYVLLPLIFKK